MFQIIKKISKINFRGITTACFILCILFFGSAPVSASTINSSRVDSLNTGLVGLWTFDGKDIVSGVALDKSGLGNNGTISNATNITGRIGQALYFNGSSAQVVTNSDFGDNISTITGSAWVYSTTAGYAKSFISKDDLAGRSWYFSVNDSSSFKVAIWTDTGGRKDVSMSGFTLNGWNHVAFTYDGANIVLYLNGVASAPTAHTGTIVRTASTPVTIGNIYNSGYLFQGKLDDVRVYSRALSQAEITRLYNMGAPSIVNKSIGPIESIANNLIGYWTFDGKDVVNGVALDKSGLGNNANLINIASSTFYTTGKIGQGFNFDGSNDYVTTNSKLSELTTAMTVSAWVKPATSQMAYADIWGNHYDDGQTRGINMQQNSTNLNQFGWGYGDGSTWKSSGLFTLQASKWQHIVAVKDSTYCRIYVDGVEDVSARGSCTTSINPSVTNNFKIGEGWTDGNRTFNGGIDDVRVYSRALSQAEITRLYNIGAPSKINISPAPKDSLATDLVGYWTFDGKNISNGVALDTSGQGNNANLVNIATSTFYAVGKIGQGFKFDGSDDYLNITNTNLINDLAGQKISLFAWVKPTLAVKNNLLSFQGSINFFIHEGRNPYYYQLAYWDGAGWKHGNTELSMDKWSYAGFIIDGTSLTFYVNGVADGTVTVNAFNVSALSSIRIGLSNGGEYAKGSIDNVHVYSRALTQAEITRLYNIGR